MSQEKQANIRARRDEIDDFWNVEDLIPKKPVRAQKPPREIHLSDVVIEPSAPKAPKGEAIPKDRPAPRMIPPHTLRDEKELPEREYTPHHSFISRVQIYRWKSTYRYYEDFVHDAERLFPIKGQECAHKPFFSYVPQYSQLDRAQLEWYLWWRENMRHGIFLPADPAYLYLYAYEQINLSGKVDPAFCRGELLKLWQNYRAADVRLNATLPDWICDMSLIHRLPPPDGEETDISGLMEHAALKEFFAGGTGREGYVKVLLHFCANYHYKKSKFYNDETKMLFKSTIPSAIDYVFSTLENEGKINDPRVSTPSVMLRDAYASALCSYRIKRRISVEYCSFSRSNELRYLITDIIKYCENRIRAVIGVRSRLSIYALPPRVKELLDEYLDKALPKPQPSQKAFAAEREAAEYEKQYDLPRKAFSLSDAEEIERASWETTQQLIEAFEEENDVDATVASIPDPIADALPLPVASGSQNTPIGLGIYLPFFAAILRGDRAGALSFAKERAMMPELIVDEINAIAANAMGDIIL